MMNKETSDAVKEGIVFEIRDYIKKYAEESNILTKWGRCFTIGESANSEGSEVCGKCVTASPCAFWRTIVPSVT